MLPGLRTTQQKPPCTPSAGAEDTHLEHDFIDGSSVRFEVEVFIVMIA